MKKFLIFIAAIFIAGCATDGPSSTADDTDFNKRAITILKPKCDAGNYSACNDLAISYQNLHDHQTAFKIYEKNCNNHFQKSCTNLANLYIYGGQFGLAQDLDKGVELHRAACINSGADSCYYLGEIYRTGSDGKEPNYKSALDAYSRGCALGDTASCTNTGIIYEFGLGVQKDEYQAMQIYKTACYNGDTLACENLKRIRGY